MMKLPPVIALLTLVSPLAADQRGDNADSKPSTPLDQLARFHVPPGFEVQLVASEPEIQKPINLNFDAAGRLWVTGSEMYPWPASTDANGQPIEGFEQGWKGIVEGFRVGDAPKPAAAATDTVRILSDFDATGRAQKIKVFADKLNIPSGVQPLPRGADAVRVAYGLPSRFDPNPDMIKRGPIGEGHLGRAPKGDTAIVYSIPNIWMMTDWDGDGFAESRIPLYTGFGYTDTHGGSSSYIYWLDGWIYGTHGFRNRSEVKDRNGQVTLLESGNTYRFRPDGSAFEIFAHGQTNPFGLAFDPLGNLFSADSHSKPVYLLQRGGFYEGIGKQHDGLGFAPRITDDDHGSSAIAGIAYNADDQWPEEYRGNLFNGNPVTQRINRDRLEWNGSSPKAIRMPDFLTCDDPWFRPVNLKFGPDGALYIADFYNPIIGHYEVPLTHPARDRSHGRIWRVVYRGDQKKAKPEEMPDLSKLGTKQLVEKLSEPNLEVRRLATNEIVDRIGPDAGETLDKILHGAYEDVRPSAGTAPLPYAALSDTEPKHYARVHARWAGDRVGLPDDKERNQLPRPPRSLQLYGTVGPILSELEYIHAARATLENLPSEAEVRAKLAVAYEDYDGPPKEAAAGSFSGINKDLLQGTPWQRRMAAELLGKQGHDIRAVDYLASALGTPAPDPALRYALRLSLKNQLSRPHFFKEAEWLGRENSTASEILADVALGVGSPESAQYLIGHLERTELRPDRASEYLKHIVLHAEVEKLARLDGLVPMLKAASPAKMISSAVSLNEAARQRQITLPAEASVFVQGRLLEGLQNADENLAKLAMASLRDVRLEAKLEPLTVVIRDEKRSAALRQAALESVANLPAGRALLGEVLTAQQHPALSKRAAELLAQHGDRETLLKTLPNASWELALAIAGGLAKNDVGAEALLTAVEGGKAPARLLVNKAVVAGFFARPKELQERAKALVKDLPPEDLRLDQVITERTENFRKASTDTLSRDKGAQLFQQHCAVCHRVRNQGGNVGPNLDGMAARGPARLLEDILDPSRNVDPAFQQVLVETRDGQSFAGTNPRNQGDTLLLTDATGKEISIPATAVKSRTTSRLSLMPPVFENQLSPEDLNHLLAYLLPP